MAGSIRFNSTVVTCVTCSISESIKAAEANGANNTNFEDICWNNAWNLNIIEEEDEAYAHAQANPTHIMVEGLDWGYKVNEI